MVFDLLGIDQALAAKLLMYPAKVDRLYTNFTVYQREPNAIMVTTHPSAGMMVWPIIDERVPCDAPVWR